ncbi:hypothetical protein FNV43_RR16647 [Rhamnella rubrinervis]|uniref:Uncharacterized protein n=1 Tax=Rhamnella rubrinervis TaxID=2594499 RepID=A0A8K0MDB7_9ROSA|nr:hypothetical protein FNV43_RR16647 [Rhamnella rubrinervis]
MNGGLSKLGTALIAVFAVCVLALLAELFYVLWRRRRFQRRRIANGESVLAGDPLYTLSSKELLYLLCWKNRSRIEPQEAHSHSSADHPQINVPDVDDLLKWQELFGPSRALFTIREEEEEREGLELATDQLNEAKTVVEDCDEAVAACTVPEVALTAKVEVEVEGTTPFSTPCNSPPYYTPLPSPTRDHDEPEEYPKDGVSGEEMAASESLEIRIDV